LREEGEREERKEEKVSEESSVKEIGGELRPRR
jgi:hypothetical protein